MLLICKILKCGIKVDYFVTIEIEVRGSIIMTRPTSVSTSTAQRLNTFSISMTYKLPFTLARQLTIKELSLFVCVPLIVL